MKISKNFSLSEFTASNTATKLGIKNIPDENVIENIKDLCINLLQPLRTKYRSPFIITSGYRNEELNKAVNGVPTSQHRLGEAADVTVVDPRRLLRMLANSNLDFDQAILYTTFLHLSWTKRGNRRQILYAKGVEHGY